MEELLIFVFNDQRMSITNESKKQSNLLHVGLPRNKE